MPGIRVLADDFGGEKVGPETADVPSCYQGDLDHILITRQEIASRIEELADEVAAAYGDAPITLLCVLKGSFAVFSQLVDALRRRRGSGLQFLDFVRLASYSGTESTGKVTLIGPNPAGQPVVPDSHVLVVEDIVDTGNTIAALRGILDSSAVSSVKVLTLLKKRTPKSDGYIPDFIGFEIPDRFVVGFGLDYNEYYRDLPMIGVLAPQGIQKYSSD